MHKTEMPAKTIVHLIYVYFLTSYQCGDFVEWYLNEMSSKYHCLYADLRILIKDTKLPN